MVKYKKVPHNENVIEINGKVVLSFDSRYKEYLKWKDENPDLEKKLVEELEQEIENKRLYNNGAPHKTDNLYRWYRKNGILSLSCEMKNGEPEGLWIKYYENGHKMEEKTLKNGKEQGLFNQWYDNGQIRSEETYKDGKEDGKWIYWYEDAIREKQGVFRNGIIVGDWTYYNIDHQKNLTEKETTEQTIETKLDFIISEFRKDLYNNINLINVAADSLADMISEVQYNLDELDRNVSKRFSDVETDIADLEDDFNRNRRKTSQTLSEIQQAITLLQIEVNEIKDKISEKDKRRKN